MEEFDERFFDEISEFLASFNHDLDIDSIERDTIEHSSQQMVINIFSIALWY